MTDHDVPIIGGLRRDPATTKGHRPVPAEQSNGSRHRLRVRLTLGPSGAIGILGRAARVPLNGDLLGLRNSDSNSGQDLT